jgi:IG-like fold at C-terminal of FixG, putative oxidoreductase
MNAELYSRNFLGGFGMKRLYVLSFLMLLLCFSMVITVAASPPTSLDSSQDQAAISRNKLLPQTTWAITRTEDTNPTILYSGSWTAVTTAILTGHASHADFTESSTAGDSAAFSFNGTWIHLGFATDRNGGEAEILIDGVSQGSVNLYTRDIDVTSFVFDDLADQPHTLTIVVSGTKQPNSSGVEVKLDFIDTWDGSLMPDGVYEETSPRVWYSVDWDFLSEPTASGGGYATTSFQGDNTAWFPFTGDTISFQALATSSGEESRLSIDGQPLATIELYSTNPVTRTFSFQGLDSGPHVLTIRHMLGAVTLDALSTPGTAPFYDNPAYTGIVRYEEYHPAFQYNGYDFRQRPQTWYLEVANQASKSVVFSSRTANDQISFTFTGLWVSLGFRSGNRGGQAEVAIDGVSQGVIGLNSASESVKSFQYGGLSTGPHTLTITVLGQPDPPSSDSYIYLDYIDVWDGSPMPDGYVNVVHSQPSSRLHFSANVMDISNPKAYQGDYAGASLPNGNNNIWYAFTGDSFTYLAFSHASQSSVEVFLDGALLDTVDQVYPYSQQPLAFHYTGFGDGPHVVRVHNVWRIQVDAFASNPTFLGPYQPIVEWGESDRTAGASIWGGIHVPIVAGDVTGDGNIELVVASSNIDNNGELFLMRGDGSDAGDGTPIIWSLPYNIFNGFEDVASPAIAELDGQPGAEIIHPTASGLYVYHSDGSIYWMTDTLKSHVFFGAPAVGNLDADPEPEIAVNLASTLAVFNADGSLGWKIDPPSAPGMPQLADLTGDGKLDILFNDADALYLYNYNLGSPTLVWTIPFTTSMEIYGAPSIADIDGQQPGGDAGPEIAVASDGWLNVVDADGSPLWSAPLDSGRPGGTAIADLDGDGEVEIVTSMLANGGMIYALNADGSRLWSAPALDNSPLSVSLMDLEGDGNYEVAWNGANQGLTLFDGSDGTVIFNESHLGVISKSGSDYPIFADVDHDGYGELVAPAQNGVRVFGFDGFWGPARPIWNQHSYHITNIEDDLSIPVSEPDSWDGHNTYRAQFTPGQAMRGVLLSALRAGLSGKPGETLVYTLDLTNRGDRTDTFSLGYAGNAWDVHLPLLQVTLAAGEKQQVHVEVTIPAGAADGQTDTVTLTATSQADPSVFESVNLTTTAVAAAQGIFQYWPVIRR